MGYFWHLFLWFLPLIIGQWLWFRPILWSNRRVVFGATILCGTYFSLCDVAAIRSGLWFFGEEHLIGLFVGPVPIEEILFFYLTSLLVAQSFILFLPQRLRWS